MSIEEMRCTSLLSFLLRASRASDTPSNRIRLPPYGLCGFDRPTYTAYYFPTYKLQAPIRPNRHKMADFDPFRIPISPLSYLLTFLRNV